MEENNEEQKVNNTEEIKPEAKETKAETKEPAKNTNVKRDYSANINFFKNIFKTPYDEIKNVAKSPKSYFIIILVSFITWVVAELIGGIIVLFQDMFSGWYSNFLSYITNSFVSILSLFFTILGPAIIIAAMSLIIYLFMKNKKKNYLTIASTLIVAYIPVITSSIISLFGYINIYAARITNVYANFATVITALLTYFAIKALYSEENDNKATITYFITMGIYFAFVLVLRLIGISI